MSHSNSSTTSLHHLTTTSEVQKEGISQFMSTPPRKTSSLDIYHVIYRGVNKQKIFEDNYDYDKFLSILRKYQTECDYKVIAYCLMSNHVHLLIKIGKVPLGKIFQHIIPSFVAWYNRKYERVGTLFQGRYMSKPVENISHLLTVIRYIHQNPVKAMLCEHPAKYEHSSFRNYFSNELIDDSIVRSEVSQEFFLNFNCAENDDKCLDIEDEKPALTDERAMKIMHRLSGCENLSEFQKLDTSIRDDVIYDLLMAGLSISCINRITGISYGVIRKVAYQRQPAEE